MSGLTRFNPLGRFSGLATLYAQCRPTYPDAALDFLIDRCCLKPNDVVVDVGCGTGISSRLFAQRGFRVLGIEPNADMRAQAEAGRHPASGPAPEYREGRAEATGLPGEVASLVLAAQAFLWFEPAAALAEFHRLLRPDGWVALLWNERDERDPFTAAYGAVIRTAPDAATVEGPRGRAGDALLASPLFQDRVRVVFANEQELDQEGMLGRAFSASYAPREAEAVEVFAKALNAVFERYQQAGRVVLRYETSVYLGRRL